MDDSKSFRDELVATALESTEQAILDPDVDTNEVAVMKALKVLMTDGDPTSDEVSIRYGMLRDSVLGAEMRVRERTQRFREEFENSREGGGV